MDQKRTPKITFFLDQYEWKKINFPSEPKKKKNEVWKQQQNSRS